MPESASTCGGILIPSSLVHQSENIASLLHANAKAPALIGTESEMGLAFGNHPDLMPPEGASILNVSNDSVLEALAIRIASAFKQHRIHINFSPDLSLFFHEILPGFDLQTEQLSNDIIHRTVLFQRLLFSEGIVVCPKGFSNFTATRSTSLQAFIPTSNAITDSLKKHTLTALADSGLMALTVNHFPSSYHSSEHLLTKPVVSDSLHRITPFAGLVISDLRDPRNDRLYLRKELYPAALLNGSDMLLIKDSLPKAIEIIASEIGKSISQAELDRKVKRILMLKA